MDFTLPLSLDPALVGLLQSGRTVLAGISGGRDSIALLTLLSRLPGCRVMACHVHHGIRRESDEEAAFVESYASRLGVPFRMRYVRAIERASNTGESLEEAARHARQEAFFDMSLEESDAIVALAHHLNDQQETALLHLCRGGSGLRGMRPISVWANGLTVLRPLLQVSRDEITQALLREGIPWRDDASNESTEFARNALRREIVPKLNEIFRRDTAIGMARACRLEHVTRMALEQALDTLDLIDPQGRLFLPKLLALPLELRQCAVHRYLKNQGVPNLNETCVLRVMEILSPDSPHSRIPLPGNLLAIRKEKRLIICRCSSVSGF